jgi:hypothetical protein
MTYMKKEFYDYYMYLQEMMMEMEEEMEESLQ